MIPLGKCEAHNCMWLGCLHVRRWGNSDHKAIPKLAWNKEIVMCCRWAPMRYENYLGKTQKETKKWRRKWQKEKQVNELNREWNKLVSLEEKKSAVAFEYNWRFCYEDRKMKENSLLEEIKCLQETISWYAPSAWVC